MKVEFEKEIRGVGKELNREFRRNLARLILIGSAMAAAVGVGYEVSSQLGRSQEPMKIAGCVASPYEEVGPGSYSKEVSGGTAVEHHINGGPWSVLWQCDTSRQAKDVKAEDNE